MAFLEKLKPQMHLIVFDPSGQNAKRECFDLGDCFFSRRPVIHYARKFRDFRDPSTVHLSFGLKGKPHPGALFQVD